MKQHRATAVHIAVILPILLSVFTPVADAWQSGAALRFESGPAPVPLIELYTSEGCSSCPPADRWLSSLKIEAGLWTHFVPLAFHVDYWDAIGWPDRFADRRFSERQRRYKQEGAVRGVYTPGVVAGGEEWRAWRRRGASPAAHDVGSSIGGELTAVLSDDELRVVYTAPPATQVSAYRMHAAWLGMDQVSEVRAGENRGKRLISDFVVLEVAELPMVVANGEVAVLFQVPQGYREDASALAVWVSANGLQAPLQATGGWLQ
jgi:hypothetical protein